jgi:hypothetical protein
MTDHSLENVVARARRGDQDAMAVIAQRAAGIGLRTAMVALADQHLAHDVSQEVAIRVLRNLGALRSGRFDAWTYQITVAETRRGDAPAIALDGVPGERRLRALSRARQDEERPPARGAAEALHAAGDAGGPHQRDRSGFTRRQRVARFIQGYNAQAVTNEHQIVIAAEVMSAGGDFGHLEPMLDAAQAELAAAGVSDTPGVLLADAGHWHQQQMQHVVDCGIQVLIPPDASKRKGARPGWDGGLYAFMRRVLDSERGGELYRQRQPMIEPVFGQTKFNRGIDRFQRRGRAAVRTEWRLITATHNLLKLHRHVLAAA